MAKLRIQLEQMARRPRLWIDDVDISNHVRAFRLTGSVGTIAEVTLTLSLPAEIEGDVARVLLNRLDPLEAESTAFDGRGVLQDGSTPERMRG